MTIAELLTQWKRFFDKDHLYWPYFLTTIIFTELAIWNVYSYMYIIKDVQEIGYFNYWIHLLQPLLFLLTVNALTPGSEDKDIEVYFKKRISLVFLLMAGFLSCHYIPGFGLAQSMDIPRIIGITLCLIVAVLKKPIWVYPMTIIWVGSLVVRYIQQ
jgi:hypothetical protein